LSRSRKLYVLRPRFGLGTRDIRRSEIETEEARRARHMASCSAVLEQAIKTSIRMCMADGKAAAG
jgi:hypothetical protein